MRYISQREMFEAFGIVHREADPFNLVSMIEPMEGKVGTVKYRNIMQVARNAMDLGFVPALVQKPGRAKKTKPSTEAQTRSNDERKLNELGMLAENNFGEDDFHLTLTYAEGFAHTISDAVRDHANFIRRLNRLRAKAGLQRAKELGRIEGADETEKRVHIHLLISGGLPREQIEACWGKGYANCDRLQPDEHGLQAIVHYIFKGYKTARNADGSTDGVRYIRSRNLEKPKTRITNCKLSKTKLRRVAADMGDDARAILEEAFPGWRVEWIQVRESAWCIGVVVRVRMRRINDGRRKEAGADALPDQPAGVRAVRGRPGDEPGDEADGNDHRHAARRR